MATVLDLITGSLRLLGVLASGESPSASEAQDALSALNNLLDTWKNDSLLVYTTSSSPYSLVGGKKSYTFGTGGDWNAERPVVIDSMFLQYTGTTGGPSPLNLPMAALTQDQYNAIIVPNTPSPIPTAFYDDGGFPLRTVSFWPVPTTNYQVNVWTWQLIDGFAAITDLINLPPGYERMMRFNLAIELAPEYGKEASPTIAAGALDSKLSIKRINSKTLFMSCDAAVTRQPSGFNYLIGV